MRDKIEFTPNKAEIIRLDWDEGTLKPGRYGDEFMYVCDSDARIMFVKPELHALIKQTGARAGEEIAITKREIKDGRSKRVQWEVERIEEEPHTAPAPPNASPRPKTSPSALTAKISAPWLSASTSKPPATEAHAKCSPASLAGSCSPSGGSASFAESNPTPARGGYARSPANMAALVQIIAGAAHAAPRTLSPSQADTFLDCPARWYYKHALGLPDPATGALALGRAVHAATAAAMRGKGASGELAPIARILELFSDLLADQLKDIELREDESADELHATGAGMVRLWLDVAAPGIQPAAVEKDLNGSIGGVPVRGVADLITTGRLLIDLKTASKKPAGITASQQLQLTTYAILGGIATAQLHTLTKTKTPAFIQHTYTPDAAAIRYAQAIYPQVQAGIESGLYPPRRNSFLCSRKHCAHWRECQDEYGGSVKE